MLIRNCPVCQTELVYGTKQSMNVASKLNTKCRKCGGVETSKKLRGREKSEAHRTHISEGKKGRSWVAMLERKYGREGAETLLRSHAEVSRERGLRDNPMRGKNWKDMVMAKNGENAAGVLAHHSECARDANGMQGRSVYQVWEEKYGKEVADSKLEKLKEGRRSRMAGSGNPMWGSPAPLGSGGGWSGWYNGLYFRSLLELAFMLELDTRGVNYVSAECLRFRVHYTYQGKDYTYYPDFYLPEEDGVVELKPLRRTQEGRFLAKKEAASKMFNYRVVTDVEVPKITRDQLKQLVDVKKVKLLPKWQERLN